MSKLFEKFHLARSNRLTPYHFRELQQNEKVVKIGRLVSLIYRPEAPSKRANSHYDHKFGDYGYKFKKGQEPLLVITQDGKQLLIIGGHYQFNSRGIVG